MRFEEMKAEPHEQIKRLAEFLDSPLLRKKKRTDWWMRL